MSAKKKERVFPSSGKAPKRHKKPVRGSQVVRINGLEQTLAGFNYELSLKVTAAISRYHDEIVEPRLVALETPFYRKLWAWVKGFFVLPPLLSRKKPIPEPDLPVLEFEDTET